MSAERRLVEVSRQLPVTPERAWAVVGDFAGLAAWLAGAEMLEADGELRRFRIGGAVFSETLLCRDEARRFLGYRLTDGPLPVEDYEVTLRVTPAAAGSRIRLSALYLPAGLAEEKCRRLLSRALGGSLDDLAAFLERGRNKALPGL